LKRRPGGSCGACSPRRDLERWLVIGVGEHWPDRTFEECLHGRVFLCAEQSRRRAGHGSGEAVPCEHLRGRASLRVSSAPERPGPWRTCALGERSNSEPLNTTCTSSRPSWTTSYSTWATAGPHDLQIHLCTPYTMSTHRNTDFSAYNMFLLRDHGAERGSQARKTYLHPTRAGRRTRTHRSSRATA
jgi:hypothetical protein